MQNVSFIFLRSSVAPITVPDTSSQPSWQLIKRTDDLTLVMCFAFFFLSIFGCAAWHVGLNTCYVFCLFFFLSIFGCAAWHVGS